MKYMLWLLTSNDKRELNWDAGYKFDAAIRVNFVNPKINTLTQPFIRAQHFNWYSRYTNLKRVEFNKFEVQQNSLAANYIGVSTARATLLSAKFVVFFRGLLKLYLHVNRETANYFFATGSAQQCNKRNRIVLIGFLT